MANFGGGGGNPFASSGGASFGGGGNPMAGSGGASFGGGGNPFAGGGASSEGEGAPAFEGKWEWDFGANNPTVGQDGGKMGGYGEKPEAVPEAVSSVSLVVLGLACLLWARLKKVKHA